MTFLMRPVFALVLVLGSLAFSGCESADFPARVRERFEAPQPKVRIYQAEQRAVFDAATRTMKRIGFTISRAGAAQGIIRAHSPLRSGDGFGVARQHSLEVRVQSFDPGVTQIAVVLREQEESESFAGATDIPLREHALYGSFFGGLEDELGLQGTEVSAGAGLE